MDLPIGEPEIMANRFLVCGLGSLGQHCVAALEKFGAQVTVIDQVVPKDWEIPGMRDSLDMFFGDCRQAKVLEQAGIKECRGILLVTRSEQVNIEAAFIARSINPHIRLVVRSSKQKLNQILGSHLQNFIAFEPNQLPAAAFALAALGENTLGCFKLDQQLVRIVKKEISPQHPWYKRFTLQEINHPNLQILCHESKNKLLYSGDIFHDWEPDDRVNHQDSIIYMQVTSSSSSVLLEGERNTIEKSTPWYKLLRVSFWKRRISKLSQWIAQDQIRRIVALCFCLVTALGIWGTLLFLTQSDVSWESAFSTTATLLLGGYGDIFGGFSLDVPFPWWLQLFSLGLTLTGIALTGVLYGLLTESILSLRLRFLSRRPPIPERNHVVLIGLTAVGQRVAQYLQEFHQPLVAVHSTEVDFNVLPQVPIVCGDLSTVLEQVNLGTAKSVITVTDDEMINLELGLLSHANNPHLELVIRTFEPRFSSHLARLLPHAQVLCAYALAAEAFAAAAYGENVLSLFQLRHHTILVTEYTIDEGDTLHRKLLSEVAYGYGVAPVLHQAPKREPVLLPHYDIRLKANDRLVVLATTDALHRIEMGTLNAQVPHWQLEVITAPFAESLFDAARGVSRIVGCDVGIVRPHLDRLPTTLPFPLYKHQGLRLVRELAKMQINARLVSMDEQPIDPAALT